jgi:hypothetical protein
MRVVPTWELVRLFEWGRPRHAVDRALGLLRAAAPHVERDTLAALTIGQRDAVLLAFRRDTIGPTLELAASCPRCAAAAEFGADCDELFAAPPSLEPNREIARFARGELTLAFRLPNSHDLAATAAIDDRLVARRVVLERCVSDLRRGGEPIAFAELAPELLDELGRAVLDADPQAELQFRLRCSNCGEGWLADLDIAAFLWTEVEVRARRALRDVDLLAQRYGWEEERILAMPSQRREFYLSLAKG